jgi:hypothetical protein
MSSCNVYTAKVRSLYVRIKRRVSTLLARYSYRTERPGLGYCLDVFTQTYRPVDIMNPQIDFVVDSLRVWHTANPNQDCEYPQAVHAWRVLGNLFGNPLKTIELEFDEETGELKRVDDGISIAVWAQSCKDLPGILKQVQNLQASGSLFDNGVSDSE